MLCCVWTEPKQFFFIAQAIIEASNESKENSNIAEKKPNVCPFKRKMALFVSHCFYTQLAVLLGPKYVTLLDNKQIW